MQAPENLVMCGLVTIDDSRWLMVVAIGEGQRFLEGDFVALERCNLIL